MNPDCTVRVTQLLAFCREHETIHCYGAGDTAFYIALYLRLHGIMPCDFVVSEGECAPDRYLGSPVCSFAALPQPQSSDGLVFALKQEAAREICRKLPAAWAARVFVVENALLRKIKHVLECRVCGGELLCEMTGVPQEILELTFTETARCGGEAFLWRVLQMTRQTPIGCFFAQKALLRNAARYAPWELTKWLPWKALRIADAASFLSMYEEIFVKQIYAFDWPEDEDGVILDLGANIGLSALFFARAYPRARIEAYEADPAIFELLRWNVAQAQASSIALYNRAVWKENGALRFRQEGADGGCVTEGAGDGVLVEAEDIRAIVRRHARVAFLKMDIEGAEREVLARAKRELLRVERIFIEYHGAADETPWLSEILRILEDSGFRIALHTDMAAEQPLKSVAGKGPYELQVNVFGVREKKSKGEKGRRQWD